ncbi:tetratricopeptide repeat protein [uncultured Rikenella sp.]|uniref:tetratricopeptide repeat protein n=1 Tax=uncultured Rikenella sp. TaxID=368003 RepID=UPI002606CA03|nr:tetratricopeptide repeat protein [uncultured Rikenella sp.]
MVMKTMPIGNRNRAVRRAAGLCGEKAAGLHGIFVGGGCRNLGVAIFVWCLFSFFAGTARAAAAPDVPAGDTTAAAATDTSAVLTAKLPAVASLDDIPADTLWARANAAYSNGGYRAAAELYEALLARGVHSGKLYYNLGNSWFKQGRMGKAILNYNRALLLDPTDEDTQYNLAMAQARIVDKIDAVPEFFLKTWLRDLGLTLSSDTWAVLGLIFLGATFAAVILWLLAHTLALRKTGFYGGIVSLVLCLACTFYAHFQRGRLLHNREAVVLNLVAPVKSSPGSGSKDIFVLHEGTQVRMLGTLDGWTEIVLSDGNKGWIASNAIEAVVKNGGGE